MDGKDRRMAFFRRNKSKTGAPELKVQKEEIHGYLNDKLKKGDTW